MISKKLTAKRDIYAISTQTPFSTLKKKLAPAEQFPNKLHLTKNGTIDDFSTGNPPKILRVPTLQKLEFFL
jgi:hypothetical protein